MRYEIALCWDFLLKTGIEENEKSDLFTVLVIELKWNKDADTAIKQIHDRKYPETLKGFCGEVILVGVNYDKDAEPGKENTVVR